MESRFIANQFDCDTLFYQGIGSSQTQAVKYVNYPVVATTGETMWSTGRNNLLPLNVIQSLYIGCELEDITLRPFATIGGRLNPVTLISAYKSWRQNIDNGLQLKPAITATPDSVKFHAPIPTLMTIGGDTDESWHLKKYQSWLNHTDRKKYLILYGISRGTAATFKAFAKYKYPEVKLVILEGAIDSVPNIIKKRSFDILKQEYLANAASQLTNKSFSLFTAYKAETIWPIDVVAEYPENIPTVFISSLVDGVVPHENTRRIAQALADKGKNDVYVCVLKNANHANYMFHNQEDRDRYECFLQAIYEKYGFAYIPELAEKGRSLLEESLIKPTVSTPSKSLAA